MHVQLQEQLKAIRAQIEKEEEQLKEIQIKLAPYIAEIQELDLRRAPILAAMHELEKREFDLNRRTTNLRTLLNTIKTDYNLE